MKPANVLLDEAGVPAVRPGDPIAGFDGGWLAGLAPVGETGLVMIVQTRD